MLKDQKHTVFIEELDITLSTGSIAKLANGSVFIQKGNTSVLVTVTAATSLKPDQDYFPLTVDYREKFAAAGRFPGGYFKREGRPSEKEILTSRLVDRPLRPLFPQGFMNEVQVIGMLMSTDLNNEPDILMVNAASAALMCSDIPWSGPVGCVRVADVEGQFILNPTNDQLFESRLDLIYVGNEKEMMMIEGSADQLSEERFIEALEFAHNGVQQIIAAQKKLAALVNPKKSEFKPILIDEKVLEIAKKTCGSRLEKVLFSEDKKSRSEGITALKEEVKAKLEEALGDDFENAQLRMVFDHLQESIYRSQILQHNKRADGRSFDELRAIECGTSILPVVHGSAIFQRGETQAVVLTTLGTARDAQELDALTGGAQSKSFILHYNFPPFSVGETGRFGMTSRRETGHGALAERSLLPVIPPEEDFPYSIRLVSEIMESNGSSSMASVCGGCLALMDAGVPIIAPVAGISAGLVTEIDSHGNIKNYKVLTDILGSEDHFGDMDFKIAGTREGITGFQLDLKIKGLPLEIAKEAVIRNRDARYQILDIMAKELAEPRPELKSTAPRVHAMKIDAEKIGALIGPGGKNIKRITELTGAQIDINEDNSGNIQIFSNDGEALKRAILEIQLTVGEIEVGKTYNGVVKSIKDFGIFVECLPGKEGLVHVSELSDVRVENPADVCHLGDQMTVKCIGVDPMGKVRLSRKAVICEEQGLPYTPSEARPSRSHSGGSRGGDRDRRSSGGGHRSSGGGGRREGGGGHREGGQNREGGHRRREHSSRD